jgi:hypothetical protein
MVNRWIEHIRLYAKKYNMSFACAISDRDASESYVKNKDVASNKKKKDEQEKLMVKYREEQKEENEGERMVEEDRRTASVQAYQEYQEENEKIKKTIGGLEVEPLFDGEGEKTRFYVHYDTDMAFNKKGQHIGEAGDEQLYLFDKPSKETTLLFQFVKKGAGKNRKSVKTFLNQPKPK